MERNYLPLLVAAGVGVAIGSFVTGTAAGLLPLVLLVACPLMMVFMMGSMGGMHHGDGRPDHDDRDRLEEPVRRRPRA